MSNSHKGVGKFSGVVPCAEGCIYHIRENHSAFEAVYPGDRWDGYLMPLFRQGIHITVYQHVADGHTRVCLKYLEVFLYATAVGLMGLGGHVTYEYSRNFRGSNRLSHTPNKEVRYNASV